MYHAGPFVGVTNALHAGHTVVIMRQWTPEQCLELVERHHVTNTQMVPTMFVRLLALPEENGRAPTCRRSRASSTPARRVPST